MKKLGICLLFLAFTGCGNGISDRVDELEQLVDNHEGRLDELENLVRGNRTGTPDPSTSHEARLRALEEQVNAQQ